MGEIFGVSAFKEGDKAKFGATTAQIMSTFVVPAPWEPDEWEIDWIQVKLDGAEFYTCHNVKNFDYPDDFCEWSESQVVFYKGNAENF